MNNIRYCSDGRCFHRRLGDTCFNVVQRVANLDRGHHVGCKSQSNDLMMLLFVKWHPLVTGSFCFITITDNSDPDISQSIQFTFLCWGTRDFWMVQSCKPTYLHIIRHNQLWNMTRQCSVTSSQPCLLLYILKMTMNWTLNTLCMTAITFQLRIPLKNITMKWTRMKKMSH